jgi:hypothetical protein
MDGMLERRVGFAPTSPGYRSGSSLPGTSEAKWCQSKVAKQHNISTMLRVYAAWAEVMIESDLEAIRRSMNRHAWLRPP